ncbi:MAG TPA: M48 family metalloprotease [Azospirillum sp.]
MSSRRKPPHRLAAAFLAVTLALAPVSPGHAQFGLGGSEEALGAQEHPKIVAQYGGEYRDARVQDFVQRVGGRLVQAAGATDRNWTFTVLDSDVVNAFALPGGYVYITRGLLALPKDEAELAGVMAHEIGHVLARHSRQRMNRGAITSLLAAGIGLFLGSPEIAQALNLGGGALLAKYSRDQELESDRIGAELLAKAGYDPFAMATFLQSMLRYSQYEALRKGKEAEDGFDFFATHPPTADRVDRAADLAREYPPGGTRPADTYFAAVSGMIYGDSPDNGFVRGAEFIHPKMGFRFTVPRGFSLLNGADQVLAQGPDGAMMAFDAGASQGVRDPTAYLTQVWGREARLQGVRAITIGGLPAATAVTQGETEQGRVDVRLVAIRDGDTMYRFTFLSPPGALDRYDPAFEQTAASFRRLAPGEAGRLQPRRIRVETVRPGQDVQDFVSRMPDQPYAEELFRIINDIPPGTPMQPGWQVKVIG